MTLTINLSYSYIIANSTEKEEILRPMLCKSPPHNIVNSEKNRDCCHNLKQMGILTVHMSAYICVYACKYVNRECLREKHTHTHTCTCTQKVRETDR